MNLLAVAFSFFFIINVLGNIPVYLTLLARYDLKRQRQIIFREMVIALGIILLFTFAGNFVLTKALSISREVIGIAGGILLFLIALKMVFPVPSTNGNEPIQEPFVFPLATPVIAGPGCITFVMTTLQALPSYPLMLAAIFAAWIPSLIIVLLSSYFKKLLGEKGLVAFERIGGMLIALLAVQMIARGVIELVKANFY